MTIKEYEERLKASEQKVEKKDNLICKYQAKADKIRVQLVEAGLNPEQEEYDYWTIGDVYWRLHKDYKYLLHDIKRSKNELNILIQTRDNWKTKLEVAKAKDNELTTIPQIIKDFVHSWRTNVEEYLIKRCDEYFDKKKSLNELSSKHYDYTYSLEERQEFARQYSIKYKEITEAYSDVNTFISYGKDYKNKIKKIFDKEEQEKVLDLIKRVTKYTGEIIDASDLSIGAKGDLDGVVIGKEGKAKVNTIGAGNYNTMIIVNEKHGQRFHYRVLVKKLNKSW